MTPSRNIAWIIKGELPDGGWSLQVIGGDPEVGDEATCVETGQRLKIVSFVGLIDSGAYARGVRVVELESVDGGDVNLRRGYHLVGRTDVE